MAYPDGKVRYLDRVGGFIGICLSKCIKLHILKNHLLYVDCTSIKF